MGEASLQNKTVTVSFPAKTWSIPSCCFPQCPWGNGTSIPHRMVLCWQPVSLPPLPSTTRWVWCPGGGTGTTTRVSTAWAGLSSPHQATWPAACPPPGTDPRLEKEEMQEEHWDLVQKEQHNPKTNIETGKQYWDQQTQSFTTEKETKCPSSERNVLWEGDICGTSLERLGWCGFAPSPTFIPRGIFHSAQPLSKGALCNLSFACTN